MQVPSVRKSRYGKLWSCRYSDPGSERSSESGWRLHPSRYVCPLILESRHTPTVWTSTERACKHCRPWIMVFLLLFSCPWITTFNLSAKNPCSVLTAPAHFPEVRFWTAFALRAGCSPVFNQPTCTASIETEPPSTPSTGNVSGSDGVRVPAT